jgi:3-oxoacyl-[acyl-carrier-protein] synthase II
MTQQTRKDNTKEQPDRTNDIAVTGIGIVSALGMGQEAFWENCRNAECGFSKIDHFDTNAMRTNVAAWIQHFDPKPYLPPRKYRRMSRISRMAVCASIEALRDSRLVLDNGTREKTAVILGTADGSSSFVDRFYNSFLEEGPRGTQPLFFPETVPNAPASHIAIHHGITGPNTTFSQNLISAENAMVYARHILLQKNADAVLVGGADEISFRQFSCYNALQALNPVRILKSEVVTPEPGGGIILGEGAGILILERMETALKRQAKIYAILKAGVVHGGGADLGHYDTTGAQTARAIDHAFTQAALTPRDIDQISVSANFNRELDEIEYRHINAIFKERGSDMTITPLKYLMGEFGGAGVLRSAATVLSLFHQAPLPEIKLQTLKRRGPGLIKWRKPALKMLSAGLMTSTSFGGGSSCLIFTAYDKTAS